MRKVCLLASLVVLPAFAQVSYDIVYVRAPRAGNNTFVRLPDVFFPTDIPSGSDLVLLHPNGAEEVLYAAGKGAVLDPVVSFDAQWVYFSFIPDASAVTGINPQRGLAYGGADIYKINLASRQVIRLTQQEWTPPTGSANWSSNPVSPNPANSTYLGYGVFNLGACPLPGGKLMFVSSRDGYLPNKGFTSPNLRLYIMDDDGRNVEPIGHINIGSALHPTVLTDGRVMFASFEGQGIRDQRNWALWAIWPDGRNWEPLMSPFVEGGAFHFQTQLTDGRIAVTQYYNLNDNGFGTILAFNSRKLAGLVPFGAPAASDPSNPAVQTGLWGPGVPTAFTPRYTQYPFSPPGLVNLTAFSHGEDEASSVAIGGGYAGKATHPSSAPNNDMLLVWTPGPANNLDRPTPTPYYDAGIYLLKNGAVVTDSSALMRIKNDPNYNEIQPRAVVPYSAIYGVSQPAAIPFLPNDGSLSPLLPAGTPFGLIGASSFYHRNTTPGVGVSNFSGLDSFNTAQNGDSSNWFEQGSDAGKYANSDIFAVRIVAMEGVAHRSYPNGADTGFLNFANAERLRILGEIPLRKVDGAGRPVLDSQGNPDTSFLAKIPADTPFTFQTLDKNGLVLNMAQTWHMVRPGEVRNDCGGCHAHNKLPLDFASTAAASASYSVADLTAQTPLLTKGVSGNTVTRNAGRLIADVEYYRDIKPILQRSCVQCHSKTGTAAAGLVLDDTALVNGYENTFHRLANDTDARYGIAPVIDSKTWRQSNASRYVRMFQSRRSLLVWKVFGQRLDGWLNTDHPTETTPGVAATLPAGANANNADIDYTGTIMPPPGSSVPGLTEDEKMTIARWIDLGAAISANDPPYKGYFADELKPVVALASPRAGLNTAPITTIRIGMFDAYSGIDPASLSVTVNFAVNGNAAGTELGPMFSRSNDSIWSLALSNPVSAASGHMTVRVKDNAGNLSTVDRWFSVASASYSINGLISNGAGAIVNLSGGSTTTTDANGTFTFSGLANGLHTVTPVKQGFTFTPASMIVNINSANTTANFVAMDSASAITIGDIASKDQGTSASSITAPVISTKQGNQLVLAFIGTAAGTVQSVTGGNLSWTLVSRANQQAGSAEIWRAISPSRLGRLSVKATLSQQSTASITVASFTASSTGAIASASIASGAVTGSLATTRANSFIVGAGNAADAGLKTAGAGQSIVHQFQNFWVQMRTNLIAAAGTTATLSLTTPANTRYNFTLVEVLSR